MLGDEFSLHPASGYCFPESDITIQITFNPKAVNNCIKSKVNTFMDQFVEGQIYINIIQEMKFDK